MKSIYPRKVVGSMEEFIKTNQISEVMERVFLSSGLSTMNIYQSNFFGDNFYTCHNSIPEWVEEYALELLKIECFTDSEFILFAYVSKDIGISSFIVTQRRIAWESENKGVFLIEKLKSVVFRNKSYSEQYLSFIGKNDKEICKLFINLLDNTDVFKDSCRYFFSRAVDCVSKIEEYYNDYSDNDDDNYLDFEVEFSDEIMEYRTDFTDRVNDKICEICNSVRLSKMFYVQGTPIDMARVKNVDKLVEQYDNKMIFHDYFFLLFDSTSFGNWKKGVLIASSGVYVKSGSLCYAYE